MTAFNVVRFKVKPGREEEFLDANRRIERNYPGLEKFSMFQTGESSYCAIAQWTNMDAMIAARPLMISNLDMIRDTLEDLGGGLGVTDPVSGPVVI